MERSVSHSHRHTRLYILPSSSMRKYFRILLNYKPDVKPYLVMPPSENPGYGPDNGKSLQCMVLQFLNYFLAQTIFIALLRGGGGGIILFSQLSAIILILFSSYRIIDSLVLKLELGTLEVDIDMSTLIHQPLDQNRLILS